MTQSAFRIDPARADAILDERTAALAKQPSRTSTDSKDVLSAVILRAAGRRYALPFHMLGGVLPGQTLHGLPVTDHAVVGAIQQRGEIWLVYSLAAIAGDSTSDETAGRILLLDHSGHRAAIRVDAVEGVTAIDRDTLAEIDAQEPSLAGALVRLATPAGLMVLDEKTLSNRLDRPRRSAS